MQWQTKVEQWAKDRNIIGGTTEQDQFIKLIEEIGELSHGLQKKDLNEIQDAIGDASVVLCIIAAQCGLSFEDCLTAAWEQIKDRRGVISNGVFVKSL
jgi:NTP pyrophosphatase (non-canonical NTP hydrolase)